MFLLISGGHIGCTKTVHQYSVSIQSSTKERETFSANNSETVTHKDLTLRQIVYILVFYDISFFWLLPLDIFQFNFLLRDSENDLYRVALKYAGTKSFRKLKRSFTASILKWIVTLWIDFGATSSLRSTNASVYAAPVGFPYVDMKDYPVYVVYTPP